MAIWGHDLSMFEYLGGYTASPNPRLQIVKFFMDCSGGLSPLGAYIRHSIGKYGVYFAGDV